MLLATLLNISLAEAALLEQKNGCINVLDIDIHEKKTISFISSKSQSQSQSKSQSKSKSHLFNGHVTNQINDFSLEIPVTHVIRMNEIRHLKDLLP